MRYRFLRFPQGKCKAVTMSYDDGAKEDIKLAQIINKYGLRCTFNLTNSECMTAEEIEENILSKGHEIAVHGAFHKSTGIQRTVDGIEDVLSCRKNLEERFNVIVRGMAYPDRGIICFANGTNYQDVKNYLRELDIVYARTLGNDNNSFRLPDDWYAWMPTAHHTNPEIMNYIDEFLKLDLSASYYPLKDSRLFYIWGHSFEFERDGNWDLLENICTKLSGQSDIWYATNMEIYNYVNAYNSLSYSVDGRIIYNPTLYTIWFEADGTLYSVKSGETLFL